MEKKNSGSRVNASVADEEKLVQVIVKAHQIIDEKRKQEMIVEESMASTREVNKEKWYVEILFALNVLFFPWKINKRFAINKQLYDGILVIFICVIFGLLGLAAWFAGMVAIASGVVSLCKGTITGDVFGMIGVGILLLVFGSFFTLAGREFGKITDSNRIYAYSASVLALISCVLAVLSLIK